MNDVQMKFILLLCAIPSLAFGEVGMASWYGKENTKSSTGKKLTHSKPALAHRSLPIGTKVKVTSIRSRRSVVAVVEDRGPYTKGRIADLNKIAAAKLGILKDGITKVVVERL